MKKDYCTTCKNTTKCRTCRKHPVSHIKRQVNLTADTGNFDTGTLLIIVSASIVLLITMYATYF